MNRGLRYLFVAGGIALIIAGGFLVTYARVDAGIDAYRSNTEVHDFAKRAYAIAKVHRDHPLQRVLTPIARVERVDKDPGHCAAVPPTYTGHDERAPFDHLAQVRFYTVFAIPVADVTVSCGGLQAHNGKLPVTD